MVTVTAHQGFLSYRRGRWAKLALLAAMSAVAVYALTDPVPRRNGGSAAGYALGTAGFVLILWLSALGLRKRIIGSRPYALQAWTSAHVWLGLALVVIGTLHTGFQLGWNVHSLAYLLMMIVIGSGIYGVVVYARLPARLSANRAEMTEKQMVEVIRGLDRQLDAAAQPLHRDEAGLVRLSLEDRDIGGGLWQRVSGRYGNCGNRRARDGLAMLADAGEAPARLAPILFLLDRKAAALHQLRRHIQLKTQLQLWLYVHVPMTFGLMAALVAHVVSVFLYW